MVVVVVVVVVVVEEEKVLLLYTQRIFWWGVGDCHGTGVPKFHLSGCILFGGAGRSNLFPQR